MSEPNVNAIPAAKSNVETITSMAMLTAIAYVVMAVSMAMEVMVLTLDLVAGMALTLGSDIKIHSFVVLKTPWML